MASSVAFFESNCAGTPGAGLLSDLAGMAREGKVVALTCFKQLFTVKQHVWFAFPVRERQATVTALAAMLDELGNTPLLTFVASRAIYLESAFQLLKLSNVSVVRQVLKAARDDVEAVCEERMSPQQLEARAAPLWRNWQPLLQACWAVFVNGAPAAALECVRVTRLLLVDLNDYRALSPAIESAQPIKAFLTQLAGQLHAHKIADVRYQRAAWKLLQGVLLAREPRFPDLIEHIVVSFLPAIRRRSVVRFVGAALDHPSLRQQLPPRVMTAERVGAVLQEMTSSLLVVEDVVEAAADWITTLAADLLDDNEYETLMVVVGRCEAAKPALQSCMRQLLAESVTKPPHARAAVYSALESCQDKPFPLVEGILARERGGYRSDSAATNWPVFRACCKLVESCAFQICTAAQFDASLQFLLFVLTEQHMSVIAKVHACVSLRALVEWQRVEPGRHVQERMAACSARICFGISELFRACYADVAEQPMEDDLGEICHVSCLLFFFPLNLFSLAEGLLLQLLPLQAELMTRVAPSEVQAVCFNILNGVASLWSQDLPQLVQIQLLRTVDDVFSTFFFLADKSVSPQFLPSLRDLLSDASRRSGTASEALTVLSTLALRSIGDRSDARRLAVALLSSHWTPATLLEEVSLPRVLEALLACEKSCEPAQDVFFFAKRLAALAVVAKEPPVAALVYCARMHALYLARLRVAVIDNVPPFGRLLMAHGAGSNDAREAVSLLQQLVTTTLP